MMGSMGVSINGGTPVYHPFQWDFPLQTIHFGVPFGLTVALHGLTVALHGLTVALHGFILYTALNGFAVALHDFAFSGFVWL